MANPPTLQGVEAPSEAVITLTPTKFTFELEYEPAGAADLKLVVMASAPQSNGISRAYSKAAPKVFMKYFFVNTKTREKSGDMLAVVSLDED